MSLSEQITRVVGGHNDALKELLKQLGATISSDKKADYLPTAAAELGNRYKFDNFITSGTSGLYGLPSTAVPNDVLNWIGKYNTHWWSELHGEAGIGYAEDQIKCGSMSINASSSTTLSYSKNIVINQSTGEVSLSNPQTITIATIGTSADSAADSAAELQRLADLAPVYITNLRNKTGPIYYLPVGTNVGRRTGTTSGPTLSYHFSDESGTRYCVEGTAKAPAKEVSSLKYSISAGETAYVNSTSRNAYPDNGVQNGLTYRYLGNPFTNAAKSLSIERGQYVGTGTYGESNPNSVTFKRIPQILIIHKTDSLTGTSTTTVPYIDCHNIADSSSDFTELQVHSSSSAKTYARFSGSTLYWYGNSAINQWNESQVAYYYTSIY